MALEDALVGGEGVLVGGPVRLQAAGQHERVLQRHGCALGQEGRHRVAGVTEQGDAAPAPAGHRGAAEQGPFVRPARGPDQRLYVRMPPGIIREAFLDASLRRPGLHPPVAALDHRDVVDQFPAPKRVVDHVAAGADPGDRQRLAQMRLQALGRDHAAPGDDAGEVGLIVAEQAAADLGMYPVGADDELCPHAAPIDEAQADAVPVLLQARQLGAEHDGVRLRGAHSLGQDPVQVMPVQGQIGKAIERHRRRSRVEGLPRLARVPQADDLLGGNHRHPHHLALQTEVEEHRGPVGAELQAGSDLAQFRRLLVDGDVTPPADQRQSGGQAAQPGPDDGDAAKAHARGLLG